MENYLIAIIIVVSFYLMPKASARSMQFKVYKDANNSLDSYTLDGLYMASQFNDLTMFNVVYNLIYSIAFIVTFIFTAIGAYKLHGLIGGLITIPFILGSIVFFIYSVKSLIKLLRK